MNRRQLRCTVVIITVVALFPPLFAAAQSPPSAAPATPPAAVVAPAPSASVDNNGYFKVGGASKPTRGRVTDVDKGDNGCYITYQDDKNAKSEYIEVGGFDLCSQKPPLKGKRVDLVYKMEAIQAGDCYGDPKCKRTETVPFIISAKIVE